MSTEEKNQKQKEDIRKVYDNSQHIKELLKEIVSDHIEDGYDTFEKTSIYLRQKNSKLDNFQFIQPTKEIKRSFKFTPLEDKILTSFAKNREKQTKLLNNYMEDILLQSRILEWGGISFSDEEWYKIRLEMKKMLIDNNCEFIRFFGKIYGIKSDYYILQGIQNSYPMQNPKIHVESKGNEGINRYTFWVSNSILESWYELPDITPEQIISSRKFKYYFTGNLDAKVKSFVPFPGKEMHLLKCQIVRILHSSSIVPKGYLKLAGEKFKEQLEGKVAEYDEEFKSPSFDDLKAPEGENWVHEQAYIFPNGKVIDPSIETQVDRFREISQDEGYKVKEGEGEAAEEQDKKYWKIKVVGDTIVHNRGDKEPLTHAVITIRNTRWPGTLTVWKEEKFTNIYVGFGIKAIDSNYFPTQIGKIEKDINDLDEQKEPNPEKEPVKEEEKKEGEEGEENKEGDE